MPFPIGALRNLSENIIGMPDPCEILRSTTTIDDMGYERQTWATVATTKCRIEPLGGRELTIADRLEARIDASAFLPFGTDLRVTDRLKVGTKTYEVHHITEESPDLSADVGALVSRAG